MRLGLDVDGILYNFDDTAKFLLEHHFGYQLSESTSWDYIEQNINPRHWNWLWSDGVKKHGLFRHGNCYRGTFQALEGLAEKHDLVLITKRPASAAIDTFDWIKYHKIPTKAVHVIGDWPKSIIPCDLYLDDCPKNILDLQNHGKKAILWNRPWNVDFQEPVVSISSWKELFMLLEGMRK